MKIRYPLSNLTEPKSLISTMGIWPVRSIHFTGQSQFSPCCIVWKALGIRGCSQRIDTAPQPIPTTLHIHTPVHLYPPTPRFTPPPYTFDIQILTTLYLAFNKIAEKGAQHLDDALRHNTVIFILFSSISYLSFPMFTETADTLSVFESNRRQRSTASWWCLAIQHGDLYSIFIHLISIFSHIHRNWLHSIYNRIKLETTEHSILLMAYDITW